MSESVNPMSHIPGGVTARGAPGFLCHLERHRCSSLYATICAEPLDIKQGVIAMLVIILSQSCMDTHKHFTVLATVMNFLVGTLKCNAESQYNYMQAMRSYILYDYHILEQRWLLMMVIGLQLQSQEHVHCGST